MGKIASDKGCEARLFGRNCVTGSHSSCPLEHLPIPLGGDTTLPGHLLYFISWGFVAAEGERW